MANVERISTQYIDPFELPVVQESQCPHAYRSWGDFQPEGLADINPGQARLRVPPRVLIQTTVNCPERARENRLSNNVMKIEIIFGGKSVNFSPDVLRRSRFITSVALTGQKNLTRANPRAALEDELAAGLVSAAPTGQIRRRLLKKNSVAESRVSCEHRLVKERCVSTFQTLRNCFHVPIDMRQKKCNTYEIVCRRRSGEKVVLRK